MSVRRDPARRALRALATVILPALAGVLLAPAASAAQGAQGAPGAAAPAGRVSGTLRDDASGLPLPYAVVAIPALGVERFTDAEGTFVLAPVPAGRHRVRVRRVGYEPRDTVVTVDSLGAAARLDVVMRRLAVRLAAVRVRETPACTAPGAASVDGALALVVEQLAQNAARARLLAARHPYAYLMERVVAYPGRDGPSLARPETIVVRSAERWPYRPGRVVTRSPTHAALDMHLPELEDVADSVFLATHCLDAAGTDTLFGGTYLRVDVRAWSRLRTPDVDGAIYLDTLTYQIRWSVFGLTRIPGGARGVRAVRTTQEFRELAPGLPMVVGRRGDFTLAAWAGGESHPLSEEHRLLAFQWTGTPP